MPSSTDCWGFEVGASALKAIRLQKTGSGVEMTDFEVINYKKILTSSDVDADEEIKMALEQFTNGHAIGNATVVVSVAGHQAFARFAKLPPVEPKAIDGIVKFEAVQQIPFPIEQVEWDYQIFAEEDSPEVEVGIFAITKDRLLPWLDNFHAMDIPVHGVSLSPVAAFNAIRHDFDLQQSPDGIIMMDIGTSATDLIIHDAGRLWMRTIPLGGNHFTEALVRSFKLSFSKAEKLKLEAATSKYARQIFQAMRPVFVDLVQEVQKSLGYYQSLNRDAELSKLLGLGSTFRLPGLQTFLKQQLQIEVVRLEEFNKIAASGDPDKFKAASISLSPSYGLALQGLEMEQVSCNLLPTTMVRQQVWRAKTPWFIAAAAIIFIAAGLAGWRYFSENTQYQTNVTTGRVQGIINTGTTLANEWNANKPRQLDPTEIENLYKMLLYRDVWAEVLQQIDDAFGVAEAAAASDDEATPKSLGIDDLTLAFQPPARGLSASADASDTGRPAVQVTLTGTARPFDPALQIFLKDTVIRKLKEMGEDPTQPLQIRNVSLVRLPVGEEVINDNPIIPETPGVAPLTPTELGLEGDPGTGADTPAFRRDAVEADGEAGLDTGEQRVEVSKFVITWRVEMPLPETKLKKILEQVGGPLQQETPNNDQVAKAE